MKEKDGTRKNGDWTIKNTEKIYANDFFKVFEDQVIRPDGKDGSFSTIEFAEGVAVLPLDDEEHIYLTKQFRYALGRADLEVTAGVIEGEEPLDAAKREIDEELGIKAEEWTDFGVIVENTSIIGSRTSLYLARQLHFGTPKPEGTEQIEPVKMKLDEAVEKIMRGEITHDLTVILILKAHLYLKR